MVFLVSANVVKKAMDRLLFRIIFLRMFVQQTALMERMSSFGEKDWFLLQCNKDNVYVQARIWVGLHAPPIRDWDLSCVIQTHCL